MKILWLCNTLIPEVAKRNGLDKSKPESWISAIYDDITNDNNKELIYLFPFSDEKISLTDNGTKFISYKEQLPNNKSILEKEFLKLIKEYKPDLIHIFGTEFLHCHAMIQASIKANVINNTVLSIQGLVSEYYKHFDYLIPEKYVIGKNIVQQQYNIPSVNERKMNFKARGIYEINAIQAAKHVIGRTNWDYKCVKNINPNVNYYKCNESLRESFYAKQWDYKNCCKHTIFLTQWYMPYKGLHLALQIITKLKNKYPDVVLYTTGNSFIPKNPSEKFMLTKYQEYCYLIIQNNNLENNIKFVGNLEKKEMCDQYLSSHVYLSCSAIENSPNSLGEAMILGMPCVSTDVGGVASMIAKDTEGFLYNPDEIDKAADYIDQIFSDNELASKIGQNAQKRAKVTHDKDKNYKKLMEIYDNVSEYK